MDYSFYKRSETAADSAELKAIAKELVLEEKFIELLFSRGLKSKQEIESFLSPDQSHLFDPFLLKGMAGAVKRIKQAIESGEKILVFGDYDADGVCSGSILYKYFNSKGIECVVHIPNRHVEGYGLNIEVLERLLEEHMVDLIISCDCGITAVEEVEFVLDLGLDIIITDHHECGEKLPECICINPKQNDCNYPIDYLCGAGVVFKLIEALEGREEAMQYAFITAVATIADMVPLLSENRAIVALGLNTKNINSLGLTELLKNLEIVNATANEIAFKVAPRINAAGRMGDAKRAFELIVSEDSGQISDLIEQINKDNDSRRVVSDSIIVEALEDLKSECMAENKAIVLFHPSWDKGVTGIVAAQLSNHFLRPCFIMVGDSEIAKGTCRGIEGVSVYELLQKCSDILEEFGGHAQAAGFSIKLDKIEEFKDRIQKLLSEFSDEPFLPFYTYDLEVIDRDCTLKFAKNLLLLEPTGNSNPKPNFLVKTAIVGINSLQSNFRHIQIKTSSGLGVIAFNGVGQLQFLAGGGEKKLLCEISINTYQGKEGVRLMLKAVSSEDLYINDDAAKANFIKNLALKGSKEPKFLLYEAKDLEKIVDDNLYGTLVVVGSKKSLEKTQNILKGKKLLLENMTANTKNNFSRIIVSPSFDKSLELGYFNKIIFIDTPVNSALISQLNKRTKATIYLPKLDNSKEFFTSLDLSRENLLKVYGLLSKNTEFSAPSAIDLFQQLSKKDSSLCPRVYILALSIFYELGFISISTDPFSVSIIKGTKRELCESEVYRKAKDLI